MLPGALQAFWELAENTNAAWLYGSYQVVDNDYKIIDEFHPDLAGNVSALLLAGEAIPFQASLLRAKEFYRAGEFDVYFTAAQDRDLGRRISLLGEVAKTPALITQIRVGQIKSSTNWARLPEFDREGREKVLNQPGVFARLWDLSNRSGYLHGRVSRAYLASAVWNLKHKNIFTSFSRLVSLGIFGIPFVFSPEFWEGLRSHVQPLGEIRQTDVPKGNFLFPVAIGIATFSILLLSKLHKRRTK